MSNFKNIIGKEDYYSILIFDENWATKFPKDKKTSSIIKLEQQLKIYIIQEAKYTKDLKALKSLKNKYYYKIIELANKIQENLQDLSLQYKMKSNENKLNEINKQMQQCEINLEKSHNDIKVTNYALVTEVMKVCYNIMKTNDVKLKQLEPKIDKARTLLREMIDMKITMQEEKDNTYFLLNYILGHEAVDIFDQNIDK